MQRKKQILILIAERQSEADRNWGFFHDQVTGALSADADVEIRMGDMSQLSFELSETESKIYDRAAGWSLEEFDLVVFRFIRREIAAAGSIALFLRERGIPYIDSYVQPRAYSKYSSQELRQVQGIKGIPSFRAQQKVLRPTIQDDALPFGYPIIIKDNNGRKGRLNFLAHTKEAAIAILDENPEVDFIIQAFIPNDGDYRILVMGDEPKLAILRRANNNSHLNNTSQGASSEVVPLETFTPEILADVVLAAKVEQTQVAGVDLMFNKETGQHYIIEVNSSPQLATGAVPELKLKAYTDYLTKLAHGHPIY